MTQMHRHLALQHRKQQGFSLIEMMISVAIGLMVTATVIYTVSGSGISGRKQNVQATMHDLGSLALVQLADHLRMAGFWLPSSEVMAADMMMDQGAPLFGCDGAFADPTAPWDSLACAASRGTGAQSNSLALRFNVEPGGRNWDCLGNLVFNTEAQAQAENKRLTGNAQAPTTGMVFEQIQEYLYVKSTGTASGNPGLFCRSNSNDRKTEQLLADNVDQLRIRYGVSAINAEEQNRNVAFDAPALAGRTDKYMDASELVNTCEPGSIGRNAWCAVDSVRICLVMRSEDNVNDEANTPYTDCDGEVRYMPDHRLRQAFTMTVALRNKVSAKTH